jgi:hypothetical protein
MAGLFDGEPSDQVRLRSVQAAKELEEGSEDLSGELLRDVVLSEPAGM